MGKTDNVRNREISKEVMELAGSLSDANATDNWKTEKGTYLLEK